MSRRPRGKTIAAIAGVGAVAAVILGLRGGCPAWTDGARAHWVAAIDNGDKPGYAYELWSRDGRIVEGNFYLLDMTWEEGTPISNVVRAVFPMTTIDQRAGEVHATFPENFAGDIESGTTVRMSADLRGGIGTRVPAVANPPHGPDEEIEIVFERIE